MVNMRPHSGLARKNCGAHFAVFCFARPVLWLLVTVITFSCPSVLYDQQIIVLCLLTVQFEVGQCGEVDPTNLTPQCPSILDLIQVFGIVVIDKILISTRNNETK